MKLKKSGEEACVRKQTNSTVIKFLAILTCIGAVSKYGPILCVTSAMPPHGTSKPILRFAFLVSVGWESEWGGQSPGHGMGVAEGLVEKDMLLVGEGKERVVMRVVMYIWAAGERYVCVLEKAYLTYTTGRIKV